MSPVELLEREVETKNKVNEEKQIEIKNRIKYLEEQLKNVKGTDCEVFSRIVGYFSQVNKSWNKGKLSEWEERKTYDLNQKFGKESDTNAGTNTN